MIEKLIPDETHKRKTTTRTTKTRRLKEEKPEATSTEHEDFGVRIRSGSPAAVYLPRS